MSSIFHKEYVQPFISLDHHNVAPHFFPLVGLHLKVENKGTVGFFTSASLMLNVFIYCWFLCYATKWVPSNYMCLQFSSSSCLQTSSPTVLSVLDDRHANGNGGGSPAARESRMEDELLCMSDLQELSTWEPLLVNSSWFWWNDQKLTLFYNTEVTRSVWYPFELRSGSPFSQAERSYL